jgi:hypothetical protein
MDDSSMGEIVLLFNPHQEGMTTADATGLMVSSAFVSCSISGLKLNQRMMQFENLPPSIVRKPSFI